MKLTFLIIITLNCVYSLTSQQQSDIKKKTSFSIGEIIELHSEILNEDRIINIYLPTSYSLNSIKTYPVIYLLDGSADEDFIHVSGIVQFGSFSWINMIPESIVVGISNVDRKRDFTFPTNNIKDKEEYPTTGNSDKFIRFMEDELQPLIKKNYKIDTISTLIGQSLGGLLATEILFKNPDLFDNYIIVSPSLWWDDESLLSYMPLYYNSKKSIYIAVGKEGEVMERTAQNLFDKVKDLKLKDTKLYFEFLENQNHGDALHLAVYHAFEKLFEIKD